ECCHENNLKYVAYTYDSPLVSLYSYTVLYPTNYIFIFDKSTYLELKNSGISTVWYLPLAADTNRLSSMIPTPEQKAFCTCDVSFIGSLYNEEHNLFDRLVDLPDFTRGYLEGIMAAQLEIQGYFFLEELLTDNVLKDMKAACEYNTQPDGVETDAFVYANYFIARKLTSMERQSLLHKVSTEFPLKLFTHKPACTIPNAQFMGTVDYYNTMPFIFYNSKINLNITLRSIHTGIPLRAMDILGSGGFLLTNYQEDFLDYFVPGEDFVYYENQQDLLDKIAYYLSHEEERQQIAANGFHKMEQHHTYVHRVKQILEVLN
ncbi:MAG: DUF3880 domain-containing protein, partial [Lachnospiraceae bacterium]